MRSYTNPVYSGDFADPFVWRHEREYLAIGTGGDEARGHPAPLVFPLLRSPDLVHWEPAGHALVRPDAAFGTTFWAPEIAFEHGSWWLYYSVGFGDARHQLRVARSADPLGPYEDVARLTEPEEVAFAIDAHPFRDDDGRWFLFHARDFLDTATDADGVTRAGTALVVSRLEAMDRLSSEVRTVLRARCDWQRFAAHRAMYGSTYDWHTLEGPFVVKEHGRYWCLYSGGCWQNDTYGVDFTVANHVLGPYESCGSEHGPRVLRTVPGRVIGPGHCSVTTAPDGSTRVIAYHAWDPSLSARRLCIDELTVGPHGPASGGPSWQPRRSPWGEAPTAAA